MLCTITFSALGDQYAYSGAREFAEAPLEFLAMLIVQIRSVAVTIGQTLVMASMAEMASLWPTAGGQQFFTQVRNIDLRL